jgi:hypothetical protein
VVAWLAGDWLRSSDAAVTKLLACAPTQAPAQVQARARTLK